MKRRRNFLKRMNMNKLNYSILMLFALAVSAQAAETESACKLRGGSIVPLPAEACAKEGGTMVTVTVATPAAGEAKKEAPAPVYQLSSDPKLAAAQKAVLDLLNKPVTGKAPRRGEPEGIEREAKFTECNMAVEEIIHVDYGNLFSARKNLKVNTTVNFRNLKRDEYSVMGEIGSKGGDFKGQAVYFEESPRSGGGDISISVAELYEGKYRKFNLPGLAPYWDAPRSDLWMSDGYGYVLADHMGNIATNKIRIVYILNASDDPNALKKAFDDLSAVCKPQ